jgi:hypothetical protein
MECGGTASVNVEVFSNFHHRTCNEGARGGEEVELYFLTSAPDGGGWSTTLPRRFTRKERDPVPIVCFSGGWVDLRTGLDWCGKSRLHRDSIPGPSSPATLYRYINKTMNTEN